MKPNSLYFGDCLDVVRDWPDESVDLIYLDPPFNSKRNYNQIFKGQKGKKRTFKDDLAQATAFVDTWEWNEDAIKRVEQIKKAVAPPLRMIPSRRFRGCSKTAVICFRIFLTWRNGWWSCIAY